MKMLQEDDFLWMWFKHEKMVASMAVSDLGYFVIIFKLRHWPWIPILIFSVDGSLCSSKTFFSEFITNFRHHCLHPQADHLCPPLNLPPHLRWPGAASLLRHQHQVPPCLQTGRGCR